MFKLSKNLIAQWIALFAVLIMVLNPLFTNAFADDASDVICTLNGIKTISLDDISDTENHSSVPKNICEYCNFFFFFLHVVDFKDGKNILYLPITKKILSKKFVLYKKFTLLNNHQQAPPIKL